MEAAAARLMRISPQFRNPNPAVIANLQFRRALLQAIDRQQLVDTLQAGLSAVPHSLLPPNRPDYRDIEERVTQYTYDPRVASQSVSELGYSKGADGVFQDSESRKLSVEIRTTGGQDIIEKTMFSVADYWQRIGVGVEPLLVPPQRNTDREYRANRPGFILAGVGLDANELARYHSSEILRAETNYVGLNDPNYDSPVFDGLVDRYLGSIPQRDRLDALSQLVYHLSDELPILGLYYDVEPLMIANRLVNVAARRQPGTHAWNAHEWDVK
jgi:ABC-type transport system substrate-binding protein